MIKFQENTWTDRGPDRKTEGWTDPYFTGPFRLPPGVQQAQLHLKSKIQNTILVKPKIIASQPVCKKSAQFINSS